MFTLVRHVCFIESSVPLLALSVYMMEPSLLFLPFHVPGINPDAWDSVVMVPARRQ